jgi:hypothetical protein
MSTLRIATAFACFAGMAEAAIDSCVVGTWQADLDEIATIMATQMQGAATPVGGMVTMQIAPPGTVRTEVQNMTIRVKVPNAPEMDVSVSGYSAGGMQAEGGNWAATATNYNLVGAADIMGSRMEIPFTSTTGMFGNGAGSYTCAGSTLTFTSSSTPARIPPNWKRLD